MIALTIVVTSAHVFIYNNNICKKGDGDCDSDAQCRGSLKCGDDNCEAMHKWDDYDKWVLYDSTDDCCY